MKPKLYTLITGSSEGFGKAMAIECAKRKMNLVLVALPNSGLQNLATTIIKNYNVDVITLEKDLSVEQNCLNLADDITNLNLSINMLINNVGIGSNMLFKEGTIEFYQKQIKLNLSITQPLHLHICLLLIL